LGGTGKTVLVEAIAVYLKSRGRKVAVLTRGYNRQQASPAQEAHSQMSLDYRKMGDEAYMLAQKLKDIPVIVDADRVRAARIAVKKFGVDTVILDDGFQQWHIKKDLDIVTIDSISVFGNRNMIPRGILREPVSSLKRADVFVLTNCRYDAFKNQAVIEFLSRINHFAFIIEAEHSPVEFYAFGKKEEILPVSFLKGKTAALVCAIGNPESFGTSIENLGVKSGLFFKFEDHHNYIQKEWDSIIRSAKDKNIAVVVTTEKDAARLSSLDLKKYNFDILVLKVKLGFKEDGEKFYNRLLGVYSA
jgi:tetraacyldisaccharide 4'-kinase